ncbi:dachshund c isoform X2 [Melanotaenia boesemani]|uniref:dachshund c isoform X2 n=1 Tax=Melanotaenia boesemani TaxID=1250792 RepID=UPI001C059406|nr:dachshund c isoform X2 [Melanotaenia boesemani]
MTTMATPATPTLLPAAPLGHHPTPSSVSPVTNSPPPAATSAASSPAPPVAHPALLHQFRADLLLSNGTPLKSGGAPVSSSAKPVYATASPVESTPQNNECKLVDVKGAKLASFTVKDTELICLPQAFDVFLKHLVGGLHTVYTKLKRLDIAPVVCNVEQVRVLRGLGAIQPGVNRCKLISRQDFETLYNDCTNASSRPGRPPKRLQSVTEGGTHHMLSHSGLMHAGIMPPAVQPFSLENQSSPGFLISPFSLHINEKVTNAWLKNLSALAKKIKLEAMASYHSNQQHGGPNGENGDHNPGMVLDQLPFMMMSHPLIPASLAPASVSMAMGQMNRLSTLASMANVAQLHANPPARAPTSVIKERMRDRLSPSPSLEEAQMSSNHSSSVSSSPSHTERTAETTHSLHDGLSSSHNLLGHSPGIMPRETDVTSVEYNKENKRRHTDRDNSSLAAQTTRESCDRQVYQKPPSGRETCERVSYPAGQKLTAGLHHAPFIFPEGLSSIETLLTNIQGLLRVAIENARAQEKQDQLERTELKMELVRERELRETLERQLSMEQKNRVLIQKRLKKEKRSKRRLQEALEEEVKLRDQAEHSVLHTANTHRGHQSSAAPPHTESVTQDVDGSSHDDNRLDTKATVQEGRVFLQATGIY